MRALRVVGLADDGKTVICEDSARGEQFELPADERLRAAARGDSARLSQLDSERESQMRPREIQARIRAGESVEQVAAASGMPEQKVERFAYPVLLERSRTAELAQAAHPVREDGPDVQTLHEVLTHAFSQRGQDFSAATWDSWRGDDGKWVVELSWAAGRSDFSAHWAFHPGASGGTVSPIDEHAMELLDPSPTRTLRTVRPVTELAQQAMEVQAPPARRVASAPEPVEERIESPPAARAHSVAPVEAVAPRPAATPPPAPTPSSEPTPEPEPQPAAAELDFIDDFELATPTASPSTSHADTELADTELAEPDTEVVDAVPATPAEPAVSSPEPTAEEPTSDAVEPTTPEPAAVDEPEVAEAAAVTDTAEPATEAEPAAEVATETAAEPEVEPAAEESEPAATAEPEPTPEPTPEPVEPVEPAVAESEPEPAKPAEPVTAAKPEVAEPETDPKSDPKSDTAQQESEKQEPAAAATTTEPAAAKTETPADAPAAKDEPAEQQLPMEPAARKPEPAPAPRPRKGKKGRPIVPSWEDVLLGTRSNRG